MWAVILTGEPEPAALFREEMPAEIWLERYHASKGHVAWRPSFPLSEGQQLVMQFQAKMKRLHRLDRWPKVLDLKLRKRLIREEHSELQNAMDDGDLVGIIDGACDLQYVVDGLWNKIGVNKPPFLREVHRSNMTKEPGDVRSDGKILKGPNFEPPELARIFVKTYGVAAAAVAGVVWKE